MSRDFQVTFDAHDPRALSTFWRDVLGYVHPGPPGVELAEGADPLDADAVRAFATGKLAHYKIPRYVKIVDDFPMTVTGKVRKVEMREQTTKELGLVGDGS